GRHRARASSRGAGESATSARAVRTPAAAMTSLANALEPSMRAASADGPNTGTPAARSASDTPATSGTSGPITTRSAPTRRASAVTAAGSVMSTSWHVAWTMPGLPGAAGSSVTAGSAARATRREGSRAPEPITRTRTAPTGAAYLRQTVHALPGPLTTPHSKDRDDRRRRDQAAQVQVPAMRGPAPVG